MAPMKSVEQIAARFGCTADQVRAQFRNNAADLLKMAEKADRTGRKVNGYTADQLRADSARMAARASE